MLSASTAFASGPAAFSLPDEDPLIYGGSPVASCGWPTTVFLGGCTGTLVHPEVMIYAAHCGAGVGSVRFGENGNGPARTVGTKFCRTNPQGPNLGQGKDHAFCVLSQPQNDIPIVPPLMGCETDILQPGQEVTIVGFGNADNGPFGIKREVTTLVNGIQNDEAFIGGNGKDSCQGDSGGPVYVQVDDGTWRAFGITSYGGACGTGGYYSMMHTGMEWIESELAGEGIDITPCHDADGTWAPTVDCAMFPTDPSPGAGNWGNGCSGGPLGGPGATCGPPHNAEPDDTPPTVTITAPESGTVFDTMGEGQIQIQVDALADDGDGWGVQEVRLIVNEMEFANNDDNSVPYGWEPIFPTGGYELQAIGVDHAGNEGLSNIVYIGVDMDAPEPPEPEDDTGEESGDEGDGTGEDDGDEGETGDGEEGEGTGAGGEGGSGEGKGCACDVSDGSAPGALSMGLFGLLLLRRRKS